MLSSGLRKAMKALLILLAAAWITPDANATSVGERAPGLGDKRFVSSYRYAAVRPATDDAFALVLPEVNAGTTDIFLALRRVPRAEHPRHRAARSSRMAARRHTRRRWEEPATASKARMFLLLTSCLEPTEVVEEPRFSSHIDGLQRHKACLQRSYWF